MQEVEVSELDKHWQNLRISVGKIIFSTFIFWWILSNQTFREVEQKSFLNLVIFQQNFFSKCLPLWWNTFFHNFKWKFCTISCKKHKWILFVFIVSPGLHYLSKTWVKPKSTFPFDILKFGKYLSNLLMSASWSSNFGEKYQNSSLAVYGWKCILWSWTPLDKAM